MERSQKGVYMPDSYILGIQSNGEDLQKRVLLRLGWPKGAMRDDICYAQGNGREKESLWLSSPMTRGLQEVHQVNR